MNVTNRAGFSPLHLCCQNGHNETSRVLLLANASPDVKNHVRRALVDLYRTGEKKASVPLKKIIIINLCYFLS